MVDVVRLLWSSCAFAGVRGGVGLCFLVLAVGIAAGISGPPSARAADDPPADPGAYAVFGLDSVTLRGKVTVEGGDVGANAPLGRVTMMRRAQVTGAVAATTVRLGRNAQAGTLYCTGLEPVRATDATCIPMSPPVVVATTLPIVQAHPGKERLRIEPLASLGPLLPGAYGAVRVGDKAQLELDGGEYDFRSLWVGYRSQLTCRRPCTIRISQYATVRERALVGAEAAVDAGTVRFEIGGGRGSHAAFRAYRRATVNATVYAPNGGIVLGMNGDYTGSFVGEDVLIYQRSRVTGLGGS